MNTMIQRIRQKGTSRKGFTLPEMLIVIAIIAVLVAIAIPVLSSQLNDAKTSVDVANVRAATSMAVADALIKKVGGTYYAKSGVNSTLTVDKLTTGTFYPSQLTSKSGECITVVVTDEGAVTSAGWVTKPTP